MSFFDLCGASGRPRISTFNASALLQIKMSATQRSVPSTYECTALCEGLLELVKRPRGWKINLCITCKKVLYKSKNCVICVDNITNIIKVELQSPAFLLKEK